MKVILLKSVPKVGKKDDVVDVADGYAQNVLIPKKMAMAATAHAQASLTQKKHNQVEQEKIQQQLLNKTLSSINNTITIAVIVNDKGTLFSRIDKKTIVQALAKEHVFIEEKHVVLEKEIKETGEYTIFLKTTKETLPLTIHVAPIKK